MKIKLDENLSERNESEFSVKKKKKKRDKLEPDELNIEEGNSDLKEFKKKKAISEESAVTVDNMTNSTVEVFDTQKKKRKKREGTESESIVPLVEKGNSFLGEAEIVSPSDHPIKKKKKKKDKESKNLVNEETNSSNHITKNELSFVNKMNKSYDSEESFKPTENKDSSADIKKVKKKKKKSSEKRENEAQQLSCDQWEATTSQTVGSGDSNLKEYDRNAAYYDAVDESKELIPIGTKGRYYTVSIAIPASILHETCVKQDLRTYVIGQLARAACIYSVDEIIVYDDHCWRGDSYYAEEYIGMMSMVLQYQECPQYLRKNFFPMHPYLQYNGVLNALNASHHLFAHQWCAYREGVVVSKKCPNKKSSFAYVGLENLVELDRKLDPGVRVTVHFPPELSIMRKKIGCVVSPDEPRTKAGLYWGYTVRTANSLAEVFKSDRFKEGYDLIIGTSDKGTDAADAAFKPFSHALIVFGGVEGLEAAIEADGTISSGPTSLFPHYLNVCPNQSSRTIRTEEAVLITLSVLSPMLAGKGKSKPR